MASPRCTRPRRPTRPLGMDRRPAAARCRQARRRQSGARHCKERREAQAARRSPRASASARRSLDLSLPRQRAPPQPPRAHPTIHSSRRLLPSSKGDPAASEAVATLRVEGRDPGHAGAGLQTQASGRRKKKTFAFLNKRRFCWKSSELDATRPFLSRPIVVRSSNYGQTISAI